MEVYYRRCIINASSVQGVVIISPLKFAIYTDSLLKRLEESGIRMSHGWAFI